MVAGRLAQLVAQLESSGWPLPATSINGRAPATSAPAVAEVVQPAGEGFKDAGFDLPALGCLINGKWVCETSSGTHPINAWDGTLVAEVAVAGPAEVDAAVAAARTAFPAFKAMAPLERTALIHRFADLVEANAEQLAQLETLELGKPITDARGGLAATLQTVGQRVPKTITSSPRHHDF